MSERHAPHLVGMVNVNNQLSHRARSNAKRQYLCGNCSRPRKCSFICAAPRYHPSGKNVSDGAATKVLPISAVRHVRAVKATRLPIHLVYVISVTLFCMSPRTHRIILMVMCMQSICLINCIIPLVWQWCDHPVLRLPHLQQNTMLLTPSKMINRFSSHSRL